MRRYRASVALRLPKPGHLPTTGPVDAIEQYFGGVTGLLLRRRLAWVRALLPREPLDRILEIGYGSGVFQYELCRTARVSVGIDVHPRAPAVRRRLAEDDVPSLLVQGDGGRLPFANGCFDAVILLSTLEFVPRPGRCLRESRRVLRPGGRLILLTPRELPLADRLWSLFSGRDATADFQTGRRDAQVAARRELGRGRRLRRPAWIPGWMAPYDLVSWVE